MIYWIFFDLLCMQKLHPDKKMDFYYLFSGINSYRILKLVYRIAITELHVNALGEKN